MKIPEETNREIKILLRSTRKTLGLTQQKVADRAGLHIAQYQKFEGGQRGMLSASFETTMAVLEALEIDPDVFVKQYVLS